MSNARVDCSITCWWPCWQAMSSSFTSCWSSVVIGWATSVTDIHPTMVTDKHHTTCNNSDAVLRYRLFPHPLFSKLYEQARSSVCRNKQWHCEQWPFFVIRSLWIRASYPCNEPFHQNIQSTLSIILSFTLNKHDYFLYHSSLWTQKVHLSYPLTCIHSAKMKWVHVLLTSCITWIRWLALSMVILYHYRQSLCSYPLHFHHWLPSIHNRMK